MGLQGFAPLKNVERIPAVYWPGVSGALHLHWAFSCLELPPFAAGHFNYVFVRSMPDGERTPLFIGETANFIERMQDHEQWRNAICMGMNEVHVNLSADSFWGRRLIESDLLQTHRPPLNRG